MGAGSFTTAKSKQSILFLVVQARPEFRQRLFCSTQMRIDLKRSLVALHRLADAAFVGMTMAHAGPGAEMIGVQGRRGNRPARVRGPHICGRRSICSIGAK